jgi:hypothetical protein
MTRKGKGEELDPGFRRDDEQNGIPAFAWMTSLRAPLGSRSFRAFALKTSMGDCEELDRAFAGMTMKPS